MIVETLNLGGEIYDFDLEKVRITKLAEGVYLSQITFNKPKYFDIILGSTICSEGTFETISVIPKEGDQEILAMFEFVFKPENKEEKEEFERGFITIAPDCAKYTFPVVFIRYDVYQKSLENPLVEIGGEKSD